MGRGSLPFCLSAREHVSTLRSCFNQLIEQTGTVSTRQGDNHSPCLAVRSLKPPYERQAPQKQTGRATNRPSQVFLQTYGCDSSSTRLSWQPDIPGLSRLVSLPRPPSLPSFPGGTVRLDQHDRKQSHNARPFEAVSPACPVSKSNSSQTSSNRIAFQ